jgi:S-DNA-T family DNA segregation ATPase FtsK/SpoIIIE
MLAVGLIVVGALIGLSLMAKDDVGLVGGVGDGLQAVFGVAAWVVPLTLWAAAAMLLIARLRHIDRLRWEMPLGLLFILCAIVGLIHLPENDKLGAAEEHLAGGYVGYYVSSMVSTVAGTAGGTVILLALALVGAMLAFHISLGEIARLFGRGGQALIHLFTAEVPAHPAIITAPRPVPAQAKGKAPAPAPQRADEHDGIPLDVPVNGKRRGAAVPPPATPEPSLRILGRSPEEIAATKAAPNIPLIAPKATDPAPPAPPASTPAPNPQPPAPPTVNGMAPLRSAAEIAKQLNLPMAGNSGMLWKLPAVDLLERITDVEINDRDLREKARKIEEALATFGVMARVREINSGPTVTQFALEPGEGVRVARTAALHNDLALALAAPSLRIEAPVPGMSRVGIEVPNTTPGMVGLRNILEADVFRAGKGKLKIPIGRDTHGQPVTTDLAKLPHLLIAGATGSGKSVAINSLIVSFLMQHTPDELRFLMIDPKRVELSSFNGIPHLLRPVVTEMRPEKDTGGSRSNKGPREITAIEVLKWLLWEMERRYRLFAKGAKDKDGITKVYRNIEQYHIAAHANLTVMEPLPYIVLIIDELADLMLVAPEDVETALCRLAQLARATGIHLIIATQRPSVDVVTGLIKANFPARLAFAVTSMIDSRVILDTPGAEKLLGRGDGLYTASDEAKPIRVQGTFVSDKEAEKVVNFWRVQMAPLLAAAAPASPAAPGAPAGAASTPALPQTNVPEPDWLKDLDAGGDGTEEDSMLKDAIALVKRSKYASTSMLQRRLRIGYNRAARLIEQLEDMGIVGPGDGARPREVLVTADAPEPGADLDEE